MNLKKSSNNSNKNVFMHSFLTSLKDNVWLIAIMSFVLFMYNMTNNGLFVHSTQEWRQFAPKYMFFGPQDTIMFLLIIAIYAVITVIHNFSFLLKRKAYAKYFSLGISRKELFWSKYLAGGLSVCIPILLNSIHLLIKSCSVFGYNSEQLITAVYVGLSFCLSALIAYSISTFVCTRSFNQYGAFLFSIILLFSATMIFKGIDNTVSEKLFGYQNNSSYEMVFDGIEKRLQNINPFMFLHDEIQNFSNDLEHFQIDYTELNLPHTNQSFFENEGFIDYVGNFLKTNPFQLNVQKLFIHFCWCLVLILLAFINKKSFCNIKGDHVETRHVSKWMGRIGFSIVVFFMMSTDSSHTMGTNIFISVIVFFVYEWATHLSIKIKGLDYKWYFITMAAYLPFVGLLMTGWFGYSSYVPEVDETEQAYITYQGAPDFLAGESRTNFYTKYTNKERYYNDMIYTSTDELKIITDIHKQLIEEKSDSVKATFNNTVEKEDRVSSSSILIAYRLKSGKEVFRYYDYATENVLKKMQGLDNTETVKRRQRETFLGNKAGYTLSGKVYLTDPLFENEVEIPQEQEAKLLEALYQDIEKLSLDDKYYPSKETKAIITFESNGNEMDDYINPPNRNQLKYSISTAVSRFYLTNDYINTLSFLNNLGFTINETERPNITMIEYSQLDGYNLGFEGGGTKYFRSYIDFEEEWIGWGARFYIPSEYYDTILNKAKTNQFISVGDYIITVTISGDNNKNQVKKINYYLEEEDFPDELR